MLVCSGNVGAADAPKAQNEPIGESEAATPTSHSLFNVGAADGPKGLCEPKARAKRQPCRDSRWSSYLVQTKMSRARGAAGRRLAHKPGRMGIDASRHA